MKDALLRGMPLSVKMAVSMLLVVASTMAIVQWFEARRLRDIFIGYQLDMHERSAQEQLYRFVNLLREQKNSVKALATQKSFIDHLESDEKSGWSGTSERTVVFRNSLPDWFPSKTVTRAFYQNAYAMLIDPLGRVREIYGNTERPLSHRVFHTELMLPRLMNSDGIITYVEGEPFQIVIQRVYDTGRRVRATLMFAFPIDAYFIRKSQGAILGDNELALLDTNDRVMASSNPDIIPVGMPSVELNREYCVSKKTFFSYGETEIEMMFVSLMPKATIDSLARKVLSLELEHGLIYGIAFILSSTLAVFLLSGRLRSLTKEIVDFVERRLGMDCKFLSGGDELVTMEKSFHEMKDKIITYQNNLAEEKERLAVTLGSIGDAVIATDTGGVVVLLNKVAEELTGWSRHEAIGRPLGEVFNIINEKTRIRCENPIERVLREGIIVGLANSTVLISKDGSERIIADSGAPIKDANQNIIGTVLVFSDVTEHRKAEDRVRVSLEEKEVLLKEIHHRVKNNMQIISSLLDIQAGYVVDRMSFAILNESRDRIRTMALVHEKLYKSADLRKIDFEEYIRDLTDYLYHIYVSDPGAITVEIDTKAVQLNVNTAVPLALIINELFSNALKHAFPAGGSGEIRIDLLSDQGEEFTLTIADNGVGFPEGVDPAGMETLGMQLVNTLVGQLKGEMEIRRDKGTEFKIRFKKISRKGE